MSLFQEELAELDSAEDFLDYFEIQYAPEVVHVNRLHILQRFHDYLESEPGPEDEQALRQHYAALLQRAYEDFVASDARSEKVFRVFTMHEPKPVFISVEEMFAK